MEVKYVSKDTASLFAEVTGKKVVIELLWGDRLELLDTTGSRVRVKARGKKGFLEPDAIGEESLLEVYFIDVGQGDGILIRTPDNRHIMIDGGYDRSKQPTGKNAADFVDWKFHVDYGREEIHIDTMIASHNDADHYGGLSDLLDVSQNEELDAQAVTVNTFFHAGVGWWINPANGQRWLGPTTADKKFLIQLGESRGG
jgi:glyoxylase-like metal-dependent hydrolase (beta-lactamase superfamily II)